MKGDFSRTTFDRQHHFSRVLMQQGRVLLDADWNEQTSILLHYLRTLAADLIGPHGGPSRGPYGNGFRVACDDEDGDPYKCDFSIGWGHYYVDGILCENVPPVHCPPGDAATPLTYSRQPDYPLKEDEDDAAKLETNAAYLVYLDVWERHLTHLEVAPIREVALGGPDTATRARIVCQVKVAEEPKDTPDDATCSDLFDRLIRDGVRCLRARARLETSSDDPCIIPPEARYRGAENQLYRVEIHDGGKSGASKGYATFKWSRDNGSVVFAIRTLQGSIATLDTLGPDDRRSLKEGDWVEIVDDHSVLRGEPGPLVQVESVDRVDFAVTLAVPDGTSLPVFDEESATYPLLRRWDQETETLTVQEGTWIDLEDGVQVYFEPGGTYRPGDYWLIPARTATGDVLWPTDTDGTTTPRALPPHGIEHHYAPLARISLDGNGNVTCVDDCRCTFDALAQCPDVQPAEEMAPLIEAVQANPPATDTCEDSSVQFSATVRGTEPLTYAWDFGDGNTSDVPRPSHRYQRPVPHTVQLTVTNNFGEDTGSVSVSVAPCEEDVPVPPRPEPIPFDANVASLSEAGREIARKNTTLLRERLNADVSLRVAVVGFAAREEEENAAELSTKRANNVRALYVEAGLPPSRLSVHGAGVDDDSSLPSAAQRRVETRLTSLSGSGAVREEKLDMLRRIDNIGERRAETLLDSGRETPSAVAAMTVDEVRNLLNVGESDAQKIKESARRIAQG